jgi:hypothetical protein
MLRYMFYSILFCVGSESYAQVSTVNSEKGKPKAIISRLEEGKVLDISQLLQSKPRGLGENYKNRTFWGKLKNSNLYNHVFTAADKIMSKGFPPYDEIGYMKMFSNGDSQTGKDMLTRRINALSTLVWAECLENKGKYLPIIHKALNEIIYQKTWVNPRNYSNQNFDSLVELSAASYAHNLAQALYLLDDKISPTMRTDVINSLYKRVFNPILKTLENGDKLHPWLLVTNNWNAVCLAGVTGAALTVIDDKYERAKYIYIAQKYISNYIEGFTDDGYCTEGLGYYNFGFSHFLILRECVWQATKGQINFLGYSKIANIAKFGNNIEILNNVYPAIGDCKTGTKLNSWILFYLNTNLDSASVVYPNSPIAGETNTLTEDILRASSLFHEKQHSQTKANNENPSNRSYFHDAGVLTVRPNLNSACRLAATFKGGNNNEHHNHNDIGSYTIVLGKELLIEDPGLIPYTAKTFGKERYTYKTISSYGHPVPLIAQKEQKTGIEAQAKILRTEFSEAEDKFDMDLTSAYDDSEINSVIRRFTYSRINEGFIEVKDEFRFSKEKIFETAIITRGTWKQVASDEFMILRGNEIISLKVISNSNFTLIPEIISEEKGIPYTRLGIRLNNPLTEGSISIKFKPIS